MHAKNKNKNKNTDRILHQTAARKENKPEKAVKKFRGQIIRR